MWVHSRIGVVRLSLNGARLPMRPSPLQSSDVTMDQAPAHPPARPWSVADVCSAHGRGVVGRASVAVAFESYAYASPAPLDTTQGSAPEQRACCWATLTRVPEVPRSTSLPLPLVLPLSIPLPLPVAAIPTTPPAPAPALPPNPSPFPTPTPTPYPLPPIPNPSPPLPLHLIPILFLALFLTLSQVLDCSATPAALHMQVSSP